MGSIIGLRLNVYYSFLCAMKNNFSIINWRHNSFINVAFVAIIVAVFLWSYPNRMGLCVCAQFFVFRSHQVDWISQRSNFTAFFLKKRSVRFVRFFGLLSNSNAHTHARTLLAQYAAVAIVSKCSMDLRKCEKFFYEDHSNDNWFSTAKYYRILMNTTKRRETTLLMRGIGCIVIE